MLDWLTKKNDNARVYMCVKEVKWDLESASPLRRATIYALTALFRNMLIRELSIPADVIDRPLDYARSDLVKFYSGLEGIRNQNKFQLETTQKGLGRVGIEMPAFSVEHAKTTNRALEVFMCTIGTGIVPDRRDDVRLIWTLMYEAKAYTASAIQELRSVESRTNEIFGNASGGMFNEFDDDAEWEDNCDYLPSMFAKKLDLF